MNVDRPQLHLKSPLKDWNQILWFMRLGIPLEYDVVGFAHEPLGAWDSVKPTRDAWAAGFYYAFRLKNPPPQPKETPDVP
jgi:hypothetical protein